MTEEVDININTHEDNLGIIVVDLLSVSIFFSKRTVHTVQTESSYANLIGETFISYRWQHNILLRNPYS